MRRCRCESEVETTNGNELKRSGNGSINQSADRYIARTATGDMGCSWTQLRWRRDGDEGRRDRRESREERGEEGRGKRGEVAVEVEEVTLTLLKFHVTRGRPGRAQPETRRDTVD